MRIKEILTRPNIYIVGAIAALSLVALFNISNGDSRPLENENIFKAKIVEIVSESESSNPYALRPIEQAILIDIEINGQSQRKEALNDYAALKAGDSVYVQRSSISEDDERYYVIEVVRTSGIMALSVVFIVLAILVGGLKGLRSLIGLLFSFTVIFSFIIPRIVSGHDPILSALIGSIAILIVGIYASHGFNRTSIAALSGIGITLFISGYFSDLFISGLSFTGIGSDESLYLKSQVVGIDLVGVMSAGIIIAVIGVLDDIALTQASIVARLKKNSGLEGRKLFTEAMAVGRDHISALINTLVLAYTGASLPLLLLLYSSNLSFSFVLSGETIAQEVVRTLISSAALILAVPMTTAIAVFLTRDSK